MWWLFAHIPTSILFGYTLTKLFIHLILTGRTFVLLCRCVFNDTAVWVIVDSMRKKLRYKESHCNTHIIWFALFYTLRNPAPLLCVYSVIIPREHNEICYTSWNSLLIWSTFAGINVTGHRLYCPMWIKNKRYMR